MADTLSPPISQEYDSERNSYALKLGNKMLDVMMPRDEYPTAVTSILKDPDALNDIAGATTALYTRASELMQKVANDTERPVRYVFSTRNPNMTAWSRTQGSHIFGWDIVYDSSIYFKAEKVFTPNSTSEQ